MAGRSKKTNHYRDEMIGHQLVSLVARGATLYDASKELDVPWITAKDLYTKQLREALPLQEKQDIIQQELVTLSMLQKSMMEPALEGDDKCARVVLQIMERRAKYLDLDQATKLAIEVNNVNSTINEIVDVLEGEVVTAEELRRIAPQTARDEADNDSTD